MSKMHNVGLKYFKAHVENEVKLLSTSGCINSIFLKNMRVLLSEAHNEIADDDVKREKWAEKSWM